MEREVTSPWVWSRVLSLWHPQHNPGAVRSTWDCCGALVWPRSRCGVQYPPGLAPRLPSHVVGNLGMIQHLLGGKYRHLTAKIIFPGNTTHCQENNKKPSPSSLITDPAAHFWWTPPLSSSPLLLELSNYPVWQALLRNNIRSPGGTASVRAPKCQQTCWRNLLCVWWNKPLLPTFPLPLHWGRGYEGALGRRWCRDD